MKTFKLEHRIGWLDLLLTNHQAFVKFINVLHCQIVVLYNSSCRCYLYSSTGVMVISLGAEYVFQAAGILASGIQ